MSTEISRLSPNRIPSTFAWIAAGNYVLATKAHEDERHPIPAGTVMLIRSILRADGVDHTVVLHPHPLIHGESNVTGFRFLFSDFLDIFEPATDGNKVREAEIADLRAKIDDVQQQIINGPQQDTEPVVPLLPGSEPVEPDSSTSSSEPDDQIATNAYSLPALLKHPDQLSQMQEEANRRLEVARSAQEWLSTKTSMIAKHNGTLGLFYKEKAAAAIATVEDQIRYAEKIQSGVKTLGMYTGENVEVHTLREGADADPTEPLTLYQRKLFMDEESLVHAAYGGLDVRDFDKFVEELRNNDDLLNRMLPAPRSAVIMAYSRQMRDSYTKMNPFEAAHIMEANQAGWLLIRNGDNIHRVLCPDVIEGTPRMFPTENEMKRPFRGFNGNDITLESIRYTDHLNNFRRLELHYKRMLILLWGLNDREGIFGEFWDPAKYPNFMDMEFQQERFSFIYDDEGALEDIRPSFSVWVREMNDYLQSGSRVLCYWKNLLNPYTARSCFTDINSFDSKGRLTYEPSGEHTVLVAFRRGNDIYVEVPVSGYSYGIGGTREFKAKVCLTQCSNLYGYLVLDAMKPEDIDYYLNSRKYRRDYLDYVPLFMAARQHVSDEEIWEQPTRDALRQALINGNVTPEANLDNLVDHAIRRHRASRRGAALPGPGTAQFKPTTTKLLDLARSLSSMDTSLVDDIRAMINAEGRNMLRVSITGRDKILCYADTLETERDPLPREYPWVQRIEIAKCADGSISLKDRKKVRMFNKVASEHLLWEDTDLLKPFFARNCRPLRPGMTFTAEAKVIDQVARWTDGLNRMVNGPTNWEETFQTIKDIVYEESTTRIRAPSLTIGVGFYINPIPDSVVAVSINGFDWLYFHGDDQQRGSLLAWVSRIYEHPESHVRSLVGATDLPSLVKAQRFDIEYLILNDIDDGFSTLRAHHRGVSDTNLARMLAGEAADYQVNSYSYRSCSDDERAEKRREIYAQEYQKFFLFDPDALETALAPLASRQENPTTA